MKESAGILSPIAWPMSISTNDASSTTGIPRLALRRPCHRQPGRGLADDQRHRRFFAVVPKPDDTIFLCDDNSGMAHAFEHLRLPRT